ncbi:FAD binding domain-containing protein [bacterium]|nr:hypothetical protein [bacterium]MBU4134075.1 FAD binding domain-containing protein [bacterium]
MEYFVPLSLNQAEKLKKKIAGSAFLAGGTALNWRGAPAAKALIDLKKLNPQEIEASKNKIIIGAGVTIQELSLSKKVPPEIAKAAGTFTSINVRNIATVGGTAASGFFISILLPVFAAYEAEVEYYFSGPLEIALRNAEHFQDLKSRESFRFLGAKQSQGLSPGNLSDFSGKKKIANITEWLKLKRGIVCAVIIKKIQRKVKITEDKIAASDFPSIVTALGFDLNGGKISNAVIAVSGATGPLSISKTAASYLNGLKPCEADAAKLAHAALSDIKTSGNVKVSARVKQRMIESHLRALLSAI